MKRHLDVEWQSRVTGEKNTSTVHFEWIQDPHSMVMAKLEVPRTDGVMMLIATETHRGCSTFRDLLRELSSHLSTAAEAAAVVGGKYEIAKDIRSLGGALSTLAHEDFMGDGKSIKEALYAA
jgi:hypothetical protein